MGGGNHSSGGPGHVAPVSLYLTIFGALMVLTAVTVAAAYVDMGPFNTFVALAIAVTKATLVLLYFMHLRWSEQLNGLGVVAAVCFLILLLVITLGDYISRGWMAGAA